MRNWNRTYWQRCVLFVLLVTATIYSAGAFAAPLTVHQFGTFSFLQDRDGREIGGLNVDDEPTPLFVKRIGDGAVRKLNERPVRWLQRYVPCRPSVTSRLEGMLTYLHFDESVPTKQAVESEIKGGWFTEYFPAATEVEASGFPDQLTERTMGKLNWDEVQSGAGDTVEAVKDKVWNNFRRASSTPISASGVKEHFLFASAIGQMKPPIRIEEQSGGALLVVRSTIDESLVGKRAWLVSVDGDGALAYNSVTGDKNSVKELTLRGMFLTSDYRTNNLPKVRREIELELIASGLSEIEAATMLDAWEFSYFRSPGRRLFVIASPDWINKVLPMTFNPPVNLTRVFIGRIELIEQSQRELISQLSTTGLNISHMTAAYYDLFRRAPSEAAVFANAPLATLPEGFKITVPKIYWEYLGMGRFRDALILDQYDRTKNENLKTFLAEVACKEIVTKDAQASASTPPESDL